MSHGGCIGVLHSFIIHSVGSHVSLIAWWRECTSTVPKHGFASALRLYCLQPSDQVIWVFPCIILSHRTGTVCQSQLQNASNVILQQDGHNQFWHFSDARSMHRDTESTCTTLSTYLHLAAGRWMPSCPADQRPSGHASPVW